MFKDISKKSGNESNPKKSEKNLQNSNKTPYLINKVFLKEVCDSNH